MAPARRRICREEHRTSEEHCHISLQWSDAAQEARGLCEFVIRPVLETCHGERRLSRFAKLRIPPSSTPSKWATIGQYRARHPPCVVQCFSEGADCHGRLQCISRVTIWNSRPLDGCGRLLKVLSKLGLLREASRRESDAEPPRAVDSLGAHGEYQLHIIFGRKSIFRLPLRRTRRLDTFVVYADDGSCWRPP